ncbi:MAG TPA: sulfate ABC transporter permease subunit CysT [Phycisphaerae bacterium]|nr:sulfate ABC transporter permease subunit CysT [Phycisphaerae bacterium]
MFKPFKKRSVLPGFGLSMGYTMLYLSLIVLIPLAGLFFKSATLSWADIRELVTNPDLLSSLKLTFGAALIAAVINAFFGFIIAWTLVRYPFPGHKFIDAVVDLPFALPTAVSGITLATLYANTGWMGSWLEPLGIKVAYARLGVLVAMIFIGVPFVVRTLEPAMQDLDPEVEEAAASLGASRAQAFFRVVLPALVPALMTGFSLAFARAVGEYGSVIFISGRIRGETQITADLIQSELENGNYARATTVGVVMLVVSFIMLGTINGLQWWSTRRSRAV